MNKKKDEADIITEELFKLLERTRKQNMPDDFVGYLLLMICARVLKNNLEPDKFKYILKEIRDLK